MVRVVLLSGGIDSTTLLHAVAAEHGGDALHALSFRYGQKHVRELACAQVQAARVGVAHHAVIDLAALGAVAACRSALTDAGTDVPELDAIAASDRDQPPTYVPNRNMMLLSVAAAYAESHAGTEVYYGAQLQDEYGYWDCTAEFLARFNATLALNRRGAVHVHAPFVGLRKAEIVRRGMAFGVDYGETWTCYRGGDAPCAVCPSCVERQAAFAEAGATDPLAGGRPAMESE